MTVREEKQNGNIALPLPVLAGRWMRPLLIILPALLVLALNLTTREFYAWDEAYNILIGRNMMQSWDAVVRPTWIPGETRDWPSYAFDVLAFPPVISAIYAAIGAATQEAWAALDVFAALVFALYLWLAWRAVSRFNGTAGWLMLCAMAASWPLLAQMKALEAEPLVAMLTAGALYVWFRDDRRGMAACFLAGAIAGLAYLTKLWLAAPCVLAIAAVCAACAWNGGAWRREAARAAMAAAGFLVTGAAHLAFVWLTSPADVPLWLQAVYFGTFTGMGVGGIKVTGAAIAPGWAHPIWYYPAILFRDHYFLIPMLLAGLPALFEEFKQRETRLFWAMIGGGLLALGALSLPGVKEPLYILPCLFFCYAAAAGSLAAFLNAPRTRLFPLLAIAFCAASALAIAAAWASGIKPDDLTAAYAVRCILTMAGVATVIGLGIAGRTRAAIRLCGILALLAIAANALPLLRPKANLDHVVANAIRTEMATQGKTAYSVILQIQPTPQITPSDFALQLLLYPNRCHRDEEAYTNEQWAGLLDEADAFILLPKPARDDLHARHYERIRATGRPLIRRDDFEVYTP